jgi:ribosomal protein S18 acetylase RimI-like enzyme
MDVGYSAVASTWDAGFAWFLTLGVVPELQNQGVGRRLVEESVERAAARGVRKINLTVNAGNGPTVRLYGNLGFGPEVEAADYFGPGEDRLVMSWRQSDSGKDVERRRGRRDCPSPDIGFS